MSTSNRSSVLIPWSATTIADTALVCIPWAGAGATPFRVWGPELDGDAAVYGVRLAGRENRQTEPPATDLATAIAELAGEVATLDVANVVLYGQCSGAVLAFELAHAVRRAERGPRLGHLVVASQLPPSVVADAPVESTGDLSRYVPEDLREEAELLDVLIPILAADMNLIAHYAYAPVEPLDVPLTVVRGDRDGQLIQSDMDGWRRETTASTNFLEIQDADHLFAGKAWLALAHAIRDVLADLS
jgi:surfactin synthase thioesterase subunit